MVINGMQLRKLTLPSWRLMQMGNWQSNYSASFIRHENEEVRLLQTFLAKDKEIYPQGLVTGMFGKLTRAAVQKFQKKHGIKDVSGIVGDNTKAKINELLKTSE